MAETLQLEVDGSRWKTEEDFYRAILSALHAPDWHGHNLDALNDSIQGGDLNGRNPPLMITIFGSQTMGRDAERIARRFMSLCDDLAKEGIQIETALAI